MQLVLAKVPDISVCDFRESSDWPKLRELKVIMTAAKTGRLRTICLRPLTRFRIRITVKMIRQYEQRVWITKIW